MRDGVFHTTTALLALTVGLSLSNGLGWAGYVAGQAVLAFFFVQTFVLLHEAGHGTLFPNRRANRVVGHLAGLLTLVPFWSWQRVHARHHRYTGWQDLDPTTASLVPGYLAPWKRRVINFAWATGLPLFVVAYRLQNFWNLPRIERYITRPDDRLRIRRNLLALILAYCLLLAWVGPLVLLLLLGPGFLFSLVLQEALIMSQHTHVPQRLSNAQPVRPFPPQEQAAFTRSLRLPATCSFLLLHFDAHELHHIYPFVPGYHLRRIPYRPANEVNWWQWLKTARALDGTDFLFRNWDDTGAKI